MIKNKPIVIKPYVSSLTSIIRSNGDDVLGSVLSRVRSSHDPVFIYDDTDKFLGLISPFETIFSSNYPYTTKVSSIVFSPPAIAKQTPVYEVAKYMLATKMYTLPVSNKEGLIEGVVYVKDILEGVVNSPELLEFVSDNIEIHAPISSPVTASVKEVFHEFKERGVSRMILTDEGGSVAGIVTRGDMMQAVIKPTDKLRFPNEGSKVGRRSLAGEKQSRKKEPVTQYYTALVDTLPDNTPNIEIVKHLIISPHDSIILTNRLHRPTGFLSTRDILQSLTKLRPKKAIHIMINKPSSAVSDKQLKEATDYLDQFAKKLSRRMDVEKIEVTSGELKNNVGQVREFKLTLIVTPVAGSSIIAETKDRSFLSSVQAATTLIEKQHRRSGLSKKETRKS